jgi:hypothetical protein
VPQLVLRELGGDSVPAGDPYCREAHEHVKHFASV